ncbi:MAG: hypothetical protein EOO39_24825, partial [Cytophagaceae bacterium]
MKDHTYCKYVLTLITCILQTCYTVNGQDRWSLITSCDLCDGYNAVAYGNGQWVIVGDYGRVLTSTDAVVWVSQKSNTTQNLNDVVYAAGRWLCVGTNGVVLTSPDGATWSTYNTDPANRFDGVAYGGGLWIAVGRTNNARVGYGVLFTSTDGITWADQPAAHQLSYGLNKVRYLNGKWYVVGGNGVIATSSTGTNWTVGNCVLIGDAQTSAHFSIGSGTRIAMEDSIALADALTEECSAEGTTPDALQRLQNFSSRRGPDKEKLLVASRKSYLWYENISEWMQRYSPIEFIHAFMTRTGRMSDERLAEQYP